MAKTFELIVINRTSGKAYDLIDIAQEVRYVTDLNSQPGKLIFTLLNNTVNIERGDMIVFKEFRALTNNVFKGYAVNVRDNGHGITSVYAYDQLWYFKNQDAFFFGRSTASKIFAHICQRKGITHEIRAATKRQIDSKLYDGETYWAIIQDAIEQSEHPASGRKNKDRFFVYDEFGTVIFSRTANRRKNVVLSEDSLLMDYDYTRSIEGSANQVLVTQEPEGASGEPTRDHLIRHVESDPENIKKWGLLQVVVKADSGDNRAQMQELGQTTLQDLNQEERTLTCECLGVAKVIAGTQVYVDIKDRGLKQWATVESAEHLYAPYWHRAHFDKSQPNFEGIDMVLGSHASAKMSLTLLL